MICTEYRAWQFGFMLYGAERQYDYCGHGFYAYLDLEGAESGDLQCHTMQYTNVKDKNGEKIWADDIMEDDKGNIFRIYAVPGGFAFKAPHWAQDLGDLSDADRLILEPLSDMQNQSWIMGCCKVIGNIYEYGETEEAK
jgi:hypothetical protein